MPPEIMLTVAVTSIIHSVFGAGVLLFGTPLLLLFGYGFVNILIVLLPISIAINLSNLGGSLLTTFAVVRRLTLWLFSRQQIDVPVNENGIYLTWAP
jgi:hypothetical protein